MVAPGVRRPDSSKTDWRATAACLDEDPDLFFPDGEHGRSNNQLELARQVCNRCPARTKCLELALRMEIRYGMWGGTNPDERRSMKRRGLAELPEPEVAEQSWYVRSLVG